MIKIYFTFAYNIAKRYINILHFKNFCISCKIINIFKKRKCQKNRTEDIKHDIAQ